jgi:hypothetical protein
MAMAGGSVAAFSFLAWQTLNGHWPKPLLAGIYVLNGFIFAFNIVRATWKEDAQKALRTRTAPKS